MSAQESPSSWLGYWGFRKERGAGSGAGPGVGAGPGGVGGAHLALLQQPSQRALPDDVAPAQKQAHAEGHHHHQEEAAHNPRGDGRDLGPGTRRRHMGRSDLLAGFMTFACSVFPACFDRLTLFHTLRKWSTVQRLKRGRKAKDSGQRF